MSTLILLLEVSEVDRRTLGVLPESDGKHFELDAHCVAVVREGEAMVLKNRNGSMPSGPVAITDLPGLALPYGERAPDPLEDAVEQARARWHRQYARSLHEFLSPGGTHGAGEPSVGQVPSGDAPGAVTNTESGGGGGHGDSTPEPKDPWGEAVEIGTSAPIEPEVKRDNKRE